MGHPNAGKSSVVATLTENDQVSIDKRAGTTTVLGDQARAIAAASSSPVMWTLNFRHFLDELPAQARCRFHGSTPKR